MNELVAFLVGFYIIFNWQWLWTKFRKLGNRERVMFGIIVFEGALAYYYWLV